MMFAADQFVLSDDQVNCFGDEIAAVAAIDEDTASEAAELIRVTYEPLPPVFTLEEAAAEGARFSIFIMKITLPMISL